MKRGFGSLKKVVRQGRRTTIYASYAVPYDVWLRWSWTPKRVSRSFPMGNKGAAEQWLASEHKLLLDGEWQPISKRIEMARQKAARTKTQDVTIGDYWQEWLSHRTWRGHPLRPGTVYATRLTIIHHILPTLGNVRLRDITQAMVDKWEASLPDQPEMRHNSYKVLKAMLHTASTPGTDGQEPLIPHMPLTRSEPLPPRQSRTIPATPAQVRAIYRAMPADRRLAVYLAVYCGALRIGEVCGLQRGDIDLQHKTLTVRREREAVGKAVAGPVKTEGSRRTVPIPTEMVPIIKKFLDNMDDKDDDAWLFPSRVQPSKPVHPNALRSEYDHARKQAGRPDLRFHDLRHTALTWMAQEGASLKELMAEAGHTTPAMAMRYQHAVQSRQQQLANKLGENITL